MVIPFSAYLLVSNDDQTVRFFTQTFSRLSGYHASTAPMSVPVPSTDNFQLKFERISPSSNFTVYLVVQQNSPLLWKNEWVEVLIHELRTSSLSFDLGSYIFSTRHQVTPRLVHSLLEASRRQRVSTLIASDLIQLISSPPKISSVFLLNILMKSFNQLPESTQINFRLSNNPIIWGNNSYLASFFSTLLYLIPYQVTLDVDIINPFSIQVSILTTSDQYLSSIKGFILLSNYLNYVSSYFNARQWITQQSINIIFPLKSDSDFGIHQASSLYLK
jgi:hypothetical protein